MGSKERRLSYSIAFKIEVVNYAEKHGNRAAERRFGSPPTEKMIREWTKQRKYLVEADESKKTLRSCAPKWPKLEEYVKNWIIYHRKNGLAVSTKMILIEARRLAIEMFITDFAGTASWCERFMRRNGLCMRTKTTVAQKLPPGDVESQQNAVVDVLQSDEAAPHIRRVPFLAVPDPSSGTHPNITGTCNMGDTAMCLAVDGLKMEPESHSDSEPTSSGGVAKHEAISVTVPAVKCEAELNLHVIKAEPDSDHELWPVSSVNEDITMVEKPMTFMFVSVNGEQEQLQDVAAVKQELNVELATEEHQLCLRSLDYHEEPSIERSELAQSDSDIDGRVDTDVGSEIVMTDSRQEKHSEEGDCGTLSEVKQHVCHLCGKEFYRRRNLMIHKRIHTREKSFGCDVCKKEFTGKGSLKTHFLIHTGEKPFRCEFCNKQFLKNGDLVRHKRVHTGEKPYVCDVCSKTFSQRSSLTSHVRIHTGEKPFKCEVCGKEFSNSCNVVIHCRAHTGEKPYKCEVCQKVFSRWAVLAKHKRLHNRNKAEANRHQSSFIAESWVQEELHFQESEGKIPKDI